MHSTLIKDVESAGIGLRTPHLDPIFKQTQQIPWIELLADNWLYNGGLTSHYLDRITQTFKVAVHGVGLSLGSHTPISLNYLEKINTLLQRTQAIAYSEHLSFSYAGDQFIPDLLPIPYNDKTLSHCVNRIQQVQDYLGRQILVENVSSYLQFREDTFSEMEFLKALSQVSGCGILLDINNLYVNEINLGRNAKKALQHISGSDIQQFHLGGFEDKGSYVIDAHNNPVNESVWNLYTYAVQTMGPIATLIEWDNDLPSFDILNNERIKAQSILDQFNPIKSCKIEASL